MSNRILVLDNRDSFVQNLARYIRLAGVQTEVRRSDSISVAEVLAEAWLGVVLSPGPDGPEDAGICISLIKAAPQLPILGVCLGHQCLANAYGAKTLRSLDMQFEPMHGRASVCHHDGDPVFGGVPERFEAGRYHALQVALAADSALKAIAWTEAGEIMALRHEKHPHIGFQFPPESLLTPEGPQMIDNFVSLCKFPTPGVFGKMVL